MGFGFGLRLQVIKRWLLAAILWAGLRLGVPEGGGREFGVPEGGGGVEYLREGGGYQREGEEGVWSTRGMGV